MEKRQNQLLYDNSTTLINLKKHTLGLSASMGWHVSASIN